MDYSILYHWEESFRSWLIGRGTWVIEVMQKGFDPMCQCYLLEGEEYAIAIDTGCGRKDIAGYMQTLTDLPIHGVIDTHSHFDHIAGNRYFRHVFASRHILNAGTREQERIVYQDPEGNEIWSLAADEKEMQKTITFLQEGDTLDLGGRKLEIFEIGAHDEASIAILDETSRMLFVGDEAETGWCNVGSMKRTKYATIENHYNHMRKLKEQWARYDFICPGHHGTPVAKECIDHQLIVDRMIMDGFEGDANVPFTVAMGTHREGSRVACYKTAHRGYCPDAIFNAQVKDL